MCVYTWDVLINIHVCQLAIEDFADCNHNLLDSKVRQQTSLRFCQITQRGIITTGYSGASESFM